MDSRRKWGSALPWIGMLVRPDRWRLLLGLLLMMVNRMAGLVLPAATKVLIDSVLGKHQVEQLRLIVLAVLGATLVQGLTAFCVTQILSKSSWHLITDLRIRVQSHIGRLPVAFYDANRTGTLVSRTMNDVEGIRNLTGPGMIEFVGGLLTAGLAFAFLLRINAGMTLIATGFMACFALIQRKIFRFIRPIFRERGRITAEVTGRLTECYGGVRVVKGYRAEAREAAVFTAGANSLLDNVLRAITTISFTSFASTSVVGLVAALVLYRGGVNVLSGSMTLGSYVTFTMLLAYMVQPMVQVVAIGSQISEAIAGVDRTREVLAERPEDEDPRRTVTLDDAALVGDVSFHSVSFSYVEDKPVLRNVSFEAAPGTVTALVGSSGSGKSTIISLICGFHSPDSGVIRLDGIDLSTISLDSYRGLLGMVLQESFLFDGTIRDNLAFARPWATEEEILSAARIACVDEFVSRFPEGYATIVGERGVKLSGGQRQRLSIARAILADPRILILDEATSSLDSESEAMIQEGLSYLMPGRTTFVIAHRLSTIRKADQILVIEKGEIVEQGRHEALLRLHGRYYDLYLRQYALESNLFLATGEGDVMPVHVAESVQASSEAELVAQEDSAWNALAHDRSKAHVE